MIFGYDLFVEIGLLKVIFSSVILSTLFSLVFSLLFSFIGGISGLCGRFSVNFLACFSYGTPVILVGYVSGFLGGLSRAGVMGNLLPALLSLLGAILVYVFGSDVKHARIISYCVCVFVLSTFYGAQNGAYIRSNEQEARLQKLMVVEKRLRYKRELLNLPAEFPEWLVRAEPK